MKTINLRGKNGIGKIVFIDDQDFSLISNYKWYFHHDGYAHAYNSPGKMILLHRLIMKEGDGFIIDHKDGNKLNNCRDNLRVCTIAQNAWNAEISKNNKLGFKGIAKITGKNYSKPWRAQLMANGKRYYKGYFDNAKEAALAYNDLARIHHGNFARFNKVSS